MIYSKLIWRNYSYEIGRKTFIKKKIKLLFADNYGNKKSNNRILVFLFDVFEFFTSILSKSQRNGNDSQDICNQNSIK